MNLSALVNRSIEFVAPLYLSSSLETSLEMMKPGLILKMDFSMLNVGFLEFRMRYVELLNFSNKGNTRYFMFEWFRYFHSVFRQLILSYENRLYHHPFNGCHALRGASPYSLSG